MLLNISNHPVSKWSAKQKTAAEKKFGQIIDVEFPSISPGATSDEIRGMAVSFGNKIIAEYSKEFSKSGKTRIHLMGEITFCFALIDYLGREKYDFYASTSERISEQKGNRKIVEFRFVKFRKY